MQDGRIESVEVGKVIEVNVFARPKWNATGVVLVAGEEYRLTVQYGVWRDWFVTTTANGFRKWYLRPFEFMRRAKKDNWLTLMGAIDRRPETVFRIGASWHGRAQIGGELTCFANDAPFAYANNSGSVILKAVRTA